MTPQEWQELLCTSVWVVVVTVVVISLWRDSRRADAEKAKRCLLCGRPVVTSGTPATWGFEWHRGFVHFDCAEAIHAAAERIKSAEIFMEEKGG